MSQFWGNHPGTRQARGFRRVKPATPEERLASMERELERRIKVCGSNRDYWYVQMQREVIGRELERQQSALEDPEDK